MSESDTITVGLETEHIDGECDIHDCEADSHYLWRGVSEDGEKEDVVHSFVAEYCRDHSQSHAEINERLHYIGQFALTTKE